MLNEILNWWKTLWTEQKIVAGVFAGFISAFLMFLIKDAIWQSRVIRLQRKTDYRQKQLDYFYSPLYRYYRQAYSRFDTWKRINPNSQLTRQPFFDSTEDEAVEEKIFSEHSSYASQLMLQLWSEFKATDENTERSIRRERMIRTLVKEYQDLKRKLDFEYDKDELKNGEFKILQ
jgi:hypothetical protein